VHDRVAPRARQSLPFHREIKIGHAEKAIS
jgi:hypothetical protein